MRALFVLLSLSLVAQPVLAAGERVQDPTEVLKTFVPKTETGRAYFAYFVSPLEKDRVADMLWYAKYVVPSKVKSPIAKKRVRESALEIVELWAPKYGAEYYGAAGFLEEALLGFPKDPNGPFDIEKTHKALKTILQRETVAPEVETCFRTGKHRGGAFLDENFSDAKIVSR